MFILKNRIYIHESGDDILHWLAVKYKFDKNEAIDFLKYKQDEINNEKRKIKNIKLEKIRIMENSIENHKYFENKFKIEREKQREFDKQTFKNKNEYNNSNVEEIKNCFMTYAINIIPNKNIRR